MNILLITKGHPFEKEAFFSVFDKMDGLDYTHVEQPAAQVFFQPKYASPYDAFVLYDMPGIRFRRDGKPPDFLEPDEEFKQNFMDLLEAGHGFVFLHHAVAGWPAWPEFAEILGGRFLYQPAELRGEARPDSGYRHNVTHTVDVVADHPVTQGIGSSFTVEDELYLYEVFEDDVIPLLRSQHEFIDENFYSASLAIQGKMFSSEGWQHTPGSNLIGWVKSYRNSPIVYLQCGDASNTYENPAFTQLIKNAVTWVAGDEAKVWARAR